MPPLMLALPFLWSSFARIRGCVRSNRWLADNLFSNWLQEQFSITSSEVESISKSEKDKKKKQIEKKNKKED